MKASNDTGTWSTERRLVLAALAVLACAGAVLRFYHLGVPSLWIDEGFSIVHARGILSTGYPVLPQGEVSWTYFPAHYLMAAGLRMFTDLEFGARFFTALAGTLLIPAFYWMNVRLFGDRRQALLAAFLMTFMTYEIGWSRQARSYLHVQLFAVLATGAFYHFLRARHVFALVLAATCAVLSAACHKGGLVTTAILALAAMSQWDRRREWGDWIRLHRRAVVTILFLFLATMVLLVVLNRNVNPSEAFTRPGGPIFRNYIGGYTSFLGGQMKLLLGFVLAGTILSLRRHPRAALPLAMAAAAYFLHIATRSVLFHFRYILPILWIILILAAYGGVAAVRAAARLPAPYRRPVAWLAVLVFAVAVGTARFSFLPRTDYYLGFTAPKPNWEEAYRWVRGRCLADPLPGAPVTVSTFPMFHDLYLDDLGGEKLFLPFSVSGFPGEYRERPRYSEARVVTTLDVLEHAEAFIILDHLGLKMLKDENIQRHLMRYPPDRMIDGPGRFDIFLWDARSGFAAP